MINNSELKLLEDFRTNLKPVIDPFRVNAYINVYAEIVLFDDGERDRAEVREIVDHIVDAAILSTKAHLIPREK